MVEIVNPQKRTFVQGKHTHALNNMRKYMHECYSVPEAKFVRYDGPQRADVDSREAISYYEDAVLNVEKSKAQDPMEEKERQNTINWGRLLTPRPVASKTVRDHYRKNNYGPGFIMPCDKGFQRADPNRPSLWSRLDTKVAHVSSAVLSRDDNILQVGDVVVIQCHNAPFSLLRLDRPQEKTRTAPLSHVTGRILVRAEGESLVFDNVRADTTIIRYRELIMSEGQPLVIPHDALRISLEHGNQRFELHTDFLERIEDARFGAVSEEEEGDEEEDAPDIERQRLSFMQSAALVNGRSQRTRAPSRRLRDYFITD